MASYDYSSTASQQLRLDLQVAAESEIDGVGMGVLSDGTPYLTIRGLARMCGVDHTQIVRITGDWTLQPLRPREQKIRELVRAQGFDDTVAFYAVERNGVINHIVPSAVCMAILEYYAFEARTGGEQAAKSYRVLARKGFNDFVYAQVGYNPTGAPSIAWQQFHDRVSLAYHTVPEGYFSIFKEIADVLVLMIRQGVNIGSTFLPDISVGQLWARHWQSENLAIIHGERIRYQHNYPNYFPQAASNPQSPYCYPDDALPEFRRWIREVYIPQRLPGYLSTKLSQGQLSKSVATRTVEELAPRALP